MKREYWQAPLIGVGIICFRGDDVLLIERGKPPRQGAWSLPGGRQKLGETVRECARRELVQETGVQAEIGPLVDVVDSINRDGQGELQYHYTLIDFRADWADGEPRPGGDAADVRWFTPDELAKIELWDETRRVIEVARRLR